LLHELSEKIEDLEGEAKKVKVIENALKEELNERESEISKKNESLKNLQNEFSKLNDEIFNLKKSNLVLQSGNELIEDIKNKFISNNNNFLENTNPYNNNNSNQAIAEKSFLAEINNHKNKIIELESSIKIIDLGRDKYFKLNLDYQSKINNLEKELKKKNIILQTCEIKIEKKKKIIRVKKKVNLILVDLVKCKKNELKCLEAIKIFDTEKMRDTLDTIRRNEKNYLLK